MKSIITIAIILVAINITYVRFCYSDTIDEELLVLFKPGVITMPEDRISASLNEITAPPEVLLLLYEIGVQEVSKGFPEFKSEDTLRISPDSGIARLPDFSNFYILRLPSSANRDSAIFKLMELPDDVIYAEKNQRGEPEYEPNDPYRSYQWYLREEAGGINAYRSFDFSRGSSSTRIGIIDSGVDRDHEDLSSKCLGDVGYNSLHGTHVAGIAAAKTDNNIGIVGIDWYARIWAENCGNWSIPMISSAVINAVNNGCKILNNSWGVDDYSPTLYSAFTYAYQMGALPVSSMSNANAPHPYLRDSALG